MKYFSEIYFHSTSKSKRIWNDDYIQILSIDPGEKNFAIRIEKRFKEKKLECVEFDLLDFKETFIKDDMKSINEEKINYYIK